MTSASSPGQQSRSFQVVTGARSFTFRTLDEEMMEKWASTVRDICSGLGVEERGGSHTAQSSREFEVPFESEEDDDEEETESPGAVRPPGGAAKAGGDAARGPSNSGGSEAAGVSPKEVGAAAAEIVATLGSQLASGVPEEQQGELGELEAQLEQLKVTPCNG